MAPARGGRPTPRRLPGGRLSPKRADAFGRELDDLRARVVADLGERDAAYIHRVIRAQRALEVGGRGLLLLSFLPPAWLAGTTALSLSKILDNMEIGHNVMHGQYDFMRDPHLDGKSFEWDTACPADQWRHSHNYVHHTFTNIVGKDRDIGYGILRMAEEQRWRPYYLGNPIYAALLAALFQYGVAVHDLESERIVRGETTLAEKRDMTRAIWQKVRAQTVKDYVLYPALSGPSFPLVLADNATANLVRNLWAFTIIFCGHFPEGTHEFTEAQAARETRGEWYYRQVLGSANLTGSRLFHILTGNLSHQIEHHLFPELPAHRYAELSIEVRAICERYGVPYNTGPLHTQFGSVVRKIVKLSLPPRQDVLDGVRSATPLSVARAGARAGLRTGSFAGGLAGSIARRAAGGLVPSFLRGAPAPPAAPLPAAKGRRRSRPPAIAPPPRRALAARAAT
ncbi:MAG: acyl-CoA desaturase [Acidobacteriota bacterium]|nr:acyl-CoA desaturase [Acidobacteriota bacterium]